MHRVAEKFVKSLLTDEQQANSVTISQGLFDRSNADENFLKNVITGDEARVYGYDIETKLNHRSGWENRRRDQEKKHARVDQM
jgi:predicted AAA+ superfamily ATPase